MAPVKGLLARFAFGVCELCEPVSLRLAREGLLSALGELEIELRRTDEEGRGPN